MKTFGHIRQEKKFIAVLAAASLLLFACTPGAINPDPEPSDDSVSAITLEAQRISALSVILNGKAILSDYVGLIQLLISTFVIFHRLGWAIRFCVAIVLPHLTVQV